MRAYLSKFFIDLIDDNQGAYVLSGDHGNTLFAPLREVYPKHFINAGVAEQNMVGVAAGMAKQGLLPIVYGLGSFIPTRVLEQIKLDVCYENLQVIFLGDGAGAVYTEYGVSHQTFEDIACLRSIPNLKIFSPCDLHELKWCLKQAQLYKGPSYIRIGKGDKEIIFNCVEDISNTGITKIKDGNSSKPIILATGSMVSVAKNLIFSKKELSEYSLYSVSMIKPMLAESLTFLIENASPIITIEEHNHIGGLGSSICEYVTSTKPKKVLRLGCLDRFTKYCGSYNYAMKEHGLDCEQLFSSIMKMVN